MNRLENQNGDAVEPTNELSRDLRLRAEQTAKARNKQRQNIDEAALPEEAKKILQELQVHQIELEMQNEELRRAQADLEISRARYFDLFDMAPVGYCTISEKGLILETNLTAANMLGVLRKEMIRQPFSRFIHRDDQDNYYFHTKKLFETQTPQQYELRILSRDSYFWTRLDATFAQFSIGEFACRVVLSDISERRRADEEKTILENQLQQARKMETVGRLAGGVAHDFNNMLAVIIGNVELALESVNPAQEIFQDLLEIRSAANRSAKLTQQLLAYARKQVAVPKVLDLNDTTWNAMNLLKRLIGENIDLQWQPESTLWTVKSDPSQIDQILINLCTNAHDAISGPGRITIKTENKVLDQKFCTTHPGSIPGEYVMLSVCDDGCGMCQETCANIFEPFYTTKEFGKGSGLGMATIYGIVKQNNGYIEVISEPDHGSIFNVYLPRYFTNSYQKPSAASRPDQPVKMVSEEN